MGGGVKKKVETEKWTNIKKKVRLPIRRRKGKSVQRTEKFHSVLLKGNRKFIKEYNRTVKER